jgi:hypothetical protein
MIRDKYKHPMVNTMLSMDGDAELRTRLRNKYIKLMDDMGKQIRPDLKIEHVDPDELGNSYYHTADLRPSWLGGKPEHIKSGVPSRTVLAHEIGHANSIGKSVFKKIRRPLLAGLTTASAVASYPLFRAYTKLSKEQALGASLAVTGGLSALSWWDIINEESEASKNALDYLEEYNKHSRPSYAADLDKSKKTLEYALGTYKRTAPLAVALTMAAPTTAYAMDKLSK